MLERALEFEYEIHLQPCCNNALRHRGGGVNPLLNWVLELFELGASLIKSLFQWKVENGKWKIVFIFHYNACSTLQDKTSHTSTTSPGRGCHDVTGEGKNKDNPNTTSKIFKTIFHFPFSIFNSSNNLQNMRRCLC